MILLFVIANFLNEYISYKAVALLSLFALSIIAMIFDIVPVLIAATLSAFIWNFFFIPPIFTFHISNTEDVLLFALYFAIALLNGILSYKIRLAQKASRDKEEQERSIQLYNTIFNSLSHELRTPIAAIMGSADTFQEHFFTLSDQHKRDLLQQIEIASTRLNNQVENLLKMSRLESGTLQPSLDWCDLNELVNTSIHNQQERASRILFAQNEEMPLVKLDYGLMITVLDNLLINALNYSATDTKVEVSINMEEDTTVINVADNGLGIPKEEIEAVFQKFYRVDRKQTGGNGLGLAIVDGLVKAHNGSIIIQPNSPTGTQFIVRMPLETSYIRNIKYE
ncbi:MAG: hypothetical protein RL596_1636 [Bacteroidota bacterium]|jgi:two-component system sensor histidine kinase KdpD